MNKVVLCGRLTKDPAVRHSAEGNAVARYTLAVERRFKKEGEQSADFINCVAFGRSAEFAEKYFRKGTKIIIVGRIQTGSYMNQEGQKIFTTDIVIEEQEFAESKSASAKSENSEASPEANENGFMSIPEGMEDEMPFDMNLPN